MLILVLIFLFNCVSQSLILALYQLLTDHCLSSCSELGDLVCAEVEKRGGKAFLTGTPVVSDGETMVQSLLMAG